MGAALPLYDSAWVWWLRLPRFEFLKVTDPVGAVLEADQVRVIISLN